MRLPVSGVSLAEAQDLIIPGLMTFTDRTNGRVRFEFEKGAVLTLTPEKPNSARVGFMAIMGESRREGVAIAFENEDGSGDESSRLESGLKHKGLYGTLPARVSKRVVPRTKGVEGEAHLAIGTFRNGVPVPLAGCLDLVGLDGDPDFPSLVRIGTLGQDREQFMRIISGKATAEPTATLTMDRSSVHPFGLDHAVFNGSGYLQICAFVAVPRGESTEILDVLDAQRPAA